MAGTRAALGGGDICGQRVDAGGQRVAQATLASGATPGTATGYVAGGEVTDPNTHEEVTGDLTGTRFYTFGGATVALRNSSGFFLLFGDEQGSAQVMMPATIGTGGALAAATQADADATQRTAYEPYGARRGEDLDVNRGWLGQTEDAGTGLTYLNARYYDPAIGRFLSPDPLMNLSDPRTLDPYRYADNNPVVYTDATGLRPDCSGLSGDALRGCRDGYKGTTGTYDPSPRPKVNPKNQGGITAAHGATVLQTAEEIQNLFDQGYLVTRPGGTMTCGSWDCVNASNGSLLKNYTFCSATVISSCWNRAIETQTSCAADDPYCETIGETVVSVFGGYIIVLAYGVVGGSAVGALRAPPGSSSAAGITTARAANPNVAPTVNWAQQVKHIPGHPGYIVGRSQLTANPELLVQRVGTGTPVGAVPRGQPGFRERIDFGFNIGTHVAPGGTSSPTSVGIVHHRADGSVHIIPARPAT